MWAMLSTAILLMIFLGGAATGMKHHLQLSGRGGRLSSHGSATTHLPGPFSIDFLSCRWNFRNRHQDQTQFVTFSTAKLNWSLHTGMLHLVDCAKGTNDMTINAEDIKRITYTGVSAKKPAKKDEPNRKTLLWTVQSAEKCGARPELARRLRSLLQARASVDITKIDAHIRDLDLIHSSESNAVIERTIKACAIVGLVHLSLSLVYGLINERQYVPSSICYISVLNTLRKLGRVSSMERLLDAIVQLHQKISVASTLVSQRVIDEDARATNRPDFPLSHGLDVVAFNIYLATLCEYQDRASKLPKLKNQHIGDGKSGDSGIVSMTGLSKAVYLLRPGVCKERYGICPDKFSYNTVLSALANNTGKGGQRNAAISMKDIKQWLKDEIHLGGDVVTMNAMIRCHLNSGQYDDAVKLIDDARERGVHAYDRYTIDMAIVPLVVAKRSDDVFKLLLDFARKEINGNRLSDSFAAFLTRIVMSARDNELAKKVLDEMFRSDFKSERSLPFPSTRHCNIVMEGARRLKPRGEGREVAMQLLSKMLKTGIRPDIYTLTTGLGLQKNTTAMMAFWRLITCEFEVQPTEIAIRALITELGQVGDVSMACAIFDWMVMSKKRTEALNVVNTWNALLGSLGSRNNAHITVETVDREVLLAWVTQSRSDRDTERFDLSDADREDALFLISLIKGTKACDAVIVLLDFMASTRKSSIPPPDSQSYCIAAAALSYGHERGCSDSLSSDKDVKCKAIALFQRAMTANIRPDGRLLNAVLRCFGRDIDSALSFWKLDLVKAVRSVRKGRNFYDATPRKRIAEDLAEAYEGLFTVCGRAGRPDVAVRLSYAMTKDGLEPNETTLQCYDAGKRERQRSNLGRRNTSIPLKLMYENMLTIECSRFHRNDRRRTGDTRVKIII